ncbi:ankyrin, partial [Lepidopterella palustris CBS 459.81]
TALHVAARTGNEKIAQLLVEQGADLGAVDENGRTPLHQAAEAGNKAVALLLLEIGGDINAQDNYGW